MDLQLKFIGNSMESIWNGVFHGQSISILFIPPQIPPESAGIWEF